MLIEICKSGCGSVGRAFISNTTGPWFEFLNCIQIKIKDAGKGPLLQTDVIS